MAFFTNSLLIEILLGLVVLVYLLYKIWTRKYQYWEKRGIVHLKPTFPLGTLSYRLLKEQDHLGETVQKIYNKFKGERYVGTYTLSEPQLMLRDPELIKYIMTKDFSHFVNRGLFPVLKHDFLTNHLFNMEAEPWKRMRTKLSPTFTSGKMKFMFTLIEVVAEQLSDYLTPLAEKNSTVEIKDVIARFNTDIIATCAFGLEVNSLTNPDTEFRKIGRLIFHVTEFQRFIINIMMFAPKLTKLLPFALFPPEVHRFILNVLKDTIEYRENNKIVRNDFIDLLKNVKERTLHFDKEEERNGETHDKDVGHHGDDDELTLKEMAAQMLVFFGAGFETAASTTSFFLYELSKNKEIQSKVRAEIDSVLKENEGKVTYQGLQEMHYMDKCIDETLRRYASLPFLNRQCVKTYKVPDSDLVIEEGMKITIPTYAIHHDPEYYPDPLKFNPERFTEEGIKSRHHYTHLPFGEGPRVCIGKRLGLMQVKMAMVAILKHFEVSPAPGLPDQLPINPRIFVTTSAVPIELVVSKRKI